MTVKELMEQAKAAVQTEIVKQQQQSPDYNAEEKTKELFSK